MKRLIGPATVITNDSGGQVITGGGILVTGADIAAVGLFDEMAEHHPDAEILSARGGTVMPGLVNAHGHFYGMFARGMALKDDPPRSFQQVLERLWWRLDRALDDRATYLSAALGAVAALRAGCTTIFDHHASPNAIDGSLDHVGEALDALGLRGVLCYEVSDRDGPERAQAGIAENLRFARQVRSSGRLAAKFGLHASFTVGPETMAEARRAESSLGTGFHIHCAEGPEDGAHSRSRFGKKVVQRLKDEEILGPRSIVAHCVHVDEEEMEILAESATNVSHQPHSNMGNAVGWSRIVAMQERGVRVNLGTDGYNWDMVEAMRTAAALHSHSSRVPGAGVGQFAGVLLKRNAQLASETFGRKLGVLEPGAAADLVVWDYFPPTPVSDGNLPWHVQFGMHGAQVRTVLVDGRVVLQDRQVLGLDEHELAAQAQQVCPGVWDRF